MSEEYRDSTDQEGIARIEGVPERDEEGKLSRRELITFDKFTELVREKLAKGVGLAEAYAGARVAQEENKAKKTAAEAAEIAARKRQIDDERRSQKEKAGQETVQHFIENVDRILELPPEGQGIALAKLVAKNPDIEKQLDKITATLGKLHLLKGTALTPAPAKEPAE